MNPQPPPNLIPLQVRHEVPTVPHGQTMSLWPSIDPNLNATLVELGPHACPYLPGRVARDRAFLADEMSPQVYEQLMNCGFRRSGHVVYQPTCRSCRECRPVRCRVADFDVTAGKRFRRCLNRNADLTVTVGKLEPTPEKFDLYRHYQSQRHGERDHLNWPSFVDFLYDSPVETLEFCYRNGGGELMAVGICDAGPRVLSSVYFYYCPNQPRRSLGIYGALAELNYCRQTSLAFYYLGFHVEGCDAMAYKTDFRPYELLGTDGVWRQAATTSPT